MSLFKKSPILKDFSSLVVDFHSHVLPGMDDGSPSIEESLKMLNAWVGLGYKKVITSPHVIHALYPNTKEQILGQMFHLQDVIKENNIPLELEATAEYHLDYEFKAKLASGEVIPFGKNKYLLVELPFQRPSYSFEEILFDISVAGYEPVLAHPERYSYLADRFSEYETLKDRGLLFQVNMNSLNGIYGKQSQKTAEKLIKENMIEFAGTDAHHNNHLTEIKKLLRNSSFTKLVESGRLRNAELME